MTDPVPGPGPVAAVLAGSARFLRVVLAVAAVVLLLVILPGRARHPAIRTARVFMMDAVGVSEEWVRWSLLQEPPGPEELIVRFGDLPGSDAHHKPATGP